MPPFLTSPATNKDDLREKDRDGVMSDTIPTDEELARGFATIPDFPGNE